MMTKILSDKMSIIRKIALMAFLFVAWAGKVHPGDGELYKVISFNIRYDNAHDKENRWDNRKEELCRTMQKYSPDLLGMQEVLHRQLLYITGELAEYAYVGIGREDGKERGEYSPILYKKERFELLESHTFWLSEDPDAVGKKGWDAACERIVTWAKLKERVSGRVCYVFNTHFDHVGVIAQRESAGLLKRKIREIAGDFPVIVMGDFNVAPDSEPIALLTDGEHPDRLVSVYTVTPLLRGPHHTFHQFGQLPRERREIIDYVFVKSSSSVCFVHIIDNEETTRYISDHYPVMALVKI